MLGRYLLIAPVIEEGATTCKVYLPEGEWIDFWSREEFSGRQWIEVAAPINRIPVFIKSNSPESILTLNS
ncbi:MAG: hypothetical protein HY050_07500 [Actinobacteria bacterium]|nr:hypothetical protein [Actinomycetota bacterium]